MEHNPNWKFNYPLTDDKLKEYSKFIDDHHEDWSPGGGGGGSGTDNYNALSNKPSINSVQLAGNKTASQLGLATATAVSNAQTTADTADSKASSAAATAATAKTTADAANTQAQQNKTAINELKVQVEAIDTSGLATKTELQALSDTVDTKASKGELNTLTATVDTKADKTTVTALTAAVDTKADQSDLDALSTVVDSKAAASTVAALQNSVDVLKGDSTVNGSVDYKIAQAIANTKGYIVVDTLPTASSTTTSSMYIISQGQTDAGQIYITVDDGNDPPAYSWYNVGNADDIDLSGYLKVADYTTAEATQNANIQQNADDIDALEATVTGLQTTVGTKADQSDLDALTTTVAAKAAQSDVTQLQSDLSDLSDTVTQHTSDIADVNTAVALKQNKALTAATSGGATTVEAAITELDTDKQPKTLSTPITIDGESKTTVESALTALNEKSVEVDDELSKTSENPVQNKVVNSAVNSRLKVVDTMPANPEANDVLLYIGDTTEDYKQGGIYMYTGATWVMISSADVDLSEYSKNLVTDTQSSITDEQIATYDTFDTSNEAGDGAMVFGDVAEGDKNPVSGGDVYAAIPKIYTLTGYNGDGTRTLTLPRGQYVGCIIRHTGSGVGGASVTYGALGSASNGNGWNISAGFSQDAAKLVIQSVNSDGSAVIAFTVAEGQSFSTVSLIALS